MTDIIIMGKHSKTPLLQNHKLKYLKLFRYEFLLWFTSLKHLQLIQLTQIHFYLLFIEIFEPIGNETTPTRKCPFSHLFKTHGF